MRIVGICSLGLCLSSFAFGGKVTLDGRGDISHKADFMEVHVEVAAQCFKDSKSVVATNKGVASEVKAVMSSFLSTDTNSRDQVVALPGQTTRSTLTSWDNDDRKAKVICTNGWHSSSSLVLKVKDFSIWTDLQEKIFDIADKYNHETTDASSVKVTLNEPKPELYPETKKKLQSQADAVALADANRKFDRLAKQCGLVHGEKTELSSNMGSAIAYSNKAFAGAGGGGGGGAEPVVFNPDFDLIWTHAAWSVTWSFVDAGTCAELE